MLVRNYQAAGIRATSTEYNVSGTTAKTNVMISLVPLCGLFSCLDQKQFVFYSAAMSVIARDLLPRQ